MSRFATVTVAVVTLVCSACSGRAPDSAFPDVSVSPRACDFGVVGAPAIASCSVIIANEGDAKLRVDTVVDGDGEFDVVGTIADHSIVAGNSLELIVRFAPASAGDYAGAIHFVTDDPDEGTVDVALAGSAVTP